MIYKRLIPLACTLLVVLVLFGSVASATLITFETTPSGAIPVDNAALSGSYTDGLTTVSFGIDSNGDFINDLSVFFEERGENPLDSYGSNDPDGIFRGQFDRDDSGTGGNYFLRAGELSANPGFSGLNPGEVFLIVYSGVLPTSASGRLWDIDGTEANTVRAFDSGENLLGTITLTPTEGGDSLPATFSFLNLPSPIAFIQITNNSNTGPLGFDNFNATQAIPEPSAGLQMATVCLSISVIARLKRCGRRLSHV